MSHKFEEFGKVRDGLLTASAIVYGFGYLTWALFSWNRGFGAVPVLDPQYLVAGILPVTIAYGLLRLYAGIVAFEELTVLSPWRKHLGDTLTSLGTLLLLVGMIARIFRYQEAIYAAAAAAGLMVVGERLLGSKSKIRSILPQVPIVSSLLVVCGAFFLWFYSWVLFPYLPAAVGGPNGESVCFDLLQEKMSVQLQQTLFGAVKVDDGLNAVKASDGKQRPQRTRCVQVITDNGHSTLISTKQDSPWGQWIRIDNSSIEATVPCTWSSTPNLPAQ